MKSRIVPVPSISKTEPLALYNQAYPVPFKNPAPQSHFKPLHRQTDTEIMQDGVIPTIHKKKRRYTRGSVTSSERKKRNSKEGMPGKLSVEDTNDMNKKK